MGDVIVWTIAILIWLAVLPWMVKVCLWFAGVWIREVCEQFSAVADSLDSEFDLPIGSNPPPPDAPKPKPPPSPPHGCHPKQSSGQSRPRDE